ncbi:MAG: hypothetical protein I3273_06255 [Candidatus Moeniiplasma glomeromycotorum]|nr:hypothetical protein [Candidatus Moeniiplasma glomeromycotorum]MCE8168019.1 hypothetical protein [Candidatus Moeniiplasma glomeromycotorum]MCE8169687.1 hypothetical protein [Candidatus Moeniiplasma glomeromycotorum]
MLEENFKCHWCKHTHEASDLGGIGDNDRASQTYLEAKEKYEKRRADLPFRRDLNDEERKTKDLKYQKLIREAWEELNNLKDIWVCIPCWSKAKKKVRKLTGEEKGFICAVCKNEVKAKPRKVHIANKISIGIEPRRIAKVCEPCWENEIIPADIYCPRTSDGRDTFEGKNKFDCFCVLKEKYLGGRHLDQRNYDYETDLDKEE